MSGDFSEDGACPSVAVHEYALTVKDTQVTLLVYLGEEGYNRFLADQQAASGIVVKSEPVELPAVLSLHFV